MRTKDFSEVSQILKQNGVGIAKLYFKTSIPLPLFCSFLIKGRIKMPWAGKGEKTKAKSISITFSDGIKCLGTLAIKKRSNYISIGGEEKNGEIHYDDLKSSNSQEFSSNALIFIDKKYGIHSQDLTIECSSIAPADNLGVCTILSGGILW